MDTLLNFVLKTVRYSDRFHFPLTAWECHFWCPAATDRSSVNQALSQLVRLKKIEKRGIYYFLPGNSPLVKLRKKRLSESRKKWRLAKSIGKWLQKIPTIEMIAVTGSLAMDNSAPDDDVDLMIVTTPNTLWLTRFFIWLLLRSKNLRRARLTTLPEKIKNKICDNLYLDSHFLTVPVPNDLDRKFYIAHEVLQAKPIFDRSEIYPSFLKDNHWTVDLLPNGYPKRLKQVSLPSIPSLLVSKLMSPLNLLFFMIQYLYMKPKMTTEKVTLHYAYFHPDSPLDKTKPLSLK